MGLGLAPHAIVVAVEVVWVGFEDDEVVETNLTAVEVGWWRRDANARI